MKTGLFPNLPVSFDILRDLPGWPRGDGLVAYEPIVDVILDQIHGEDNDYKAKEITVTRFWDEIIL